MQLLVAVQVFWKFAVEKMCPLCPLCCLCSFSDGEDHHEGFGYVNKLAL